MTPLEKSLPLFPDCYFCGADCLVGYGFCHCGCGKKTTISPHNYPDTGIQKGEPQKYIRWHTFQGAKKFNDENYKCICRDDSCTIPHGYCHCGCGEQTLIATYTRLSTGRIKGHPRLFVRDHHKVKHGKSVKSPEYTTWTHMIQRCTNPDNQAYKDYGGRGIMVCDRWMNFENFYEDMGERPEELTLDRIDFNGNYEPGNCQWATWEQQANNRRSTIFLVYEGEIYSLEQLSRKTGLAKHTLRYRIIFRGMSSEDAVALGSAKVGINEIQRRTSNNVRTVL